MPAERVPTTEDEITTMLVSQIAALRKCDPTTIDPRRPFNAMGVDSLDALTLIAEVEATFKIHIDDAEIFDYPTPCDLARMIALRSANHVK